MDLVKLSAAGGVALTAMLALVSTAHQSAAQSPMLELPSGPPPNRIEDAFRFVDPTSPFILSGPRSPAATATVPVLPQPELPRRTSFSIAPTGIWTAYVEEASQRFGIPAEWVRGVIMIESGGRTTLGGRPITSSAGAIGLMQVMPGTFADMSARHGLGSDPYDPRANILAGTAYLRAMYDRYGPAHFLAAYNAGPARVDAHLRDGRPLPAETRRYTATLLPRLAPGAVATTVSASNPVQDLTSAEAIRALAHPSPRAALRQPRDPASASVFAVSTAPRATSPRTWEQQPRERLFVTLTNTDHRQDGSAVTPSED